MTERSTSTYYEQATNHLVRIVKQTTYEMSRNTQRRHVMEDVCPLVIIINEWRRYRVEAIRPTTPPDLSLQEANARTYLIRKIYRSQGLKNGSGHVPQ